MAQKLADRIEVKQGDITDMSVDAVVNAANNTLLGGGGVDGAIHRAAGPDLLDACRLLSGCDPGDAKITDGFRLHARWVIHTVGPVWQGGEEGEDDTLASCYRRAMALAAEKNVRTIAFPSISTGAYRFPVERAAAIAIDEVLKALQASPTPEKVSHVCFSEEDRRAYQKALDKALADAEASS